jgi:DNA-binding transcriptional LysR family regulator
MKYAMQIDMLSNRLYHEFSTKNYNVNIASTQLLSRLYFPLLYQNNNSFQLHTSTEKKLARGLENKIYDIIITHTRIDFDREVLCYSKSEQLCWARDKRIKNLEEPNLSLIVSRDKSCPLRNASFQFLASIDHAMPVIEVDTLDLMLSLLRSVNSIALLPQKIIDYESNLGKFTEYSPTSLTVYFYCNNEDEFQLIKDLI